MRSTLDVLALSLVTIAFCVSALKPTSSESGKPVSAVEGARDRITQNELPKNDVEILPQNVTEKVFYNGMKVLRVVVQNKEQRRWIRDLDNRGDASIWSNNGTAIDILIRKDDVFDFLKQKRLSYDVVIDDLQKAIEEENPQLSEEEWSELQGRKGDGAVVFRAITKFEFSLVNPIWGQHPENVVENMQGPETFYNPKPVVIKLMEAYSQWSYNGFSTPFHQWLYKDNSGATDDDDDDDDEIFIGLRKSSSKKKRKKKRRGHRMTWQMYHRMADIHGYMDYLAATYPNTCSLETIGTSTEGRPLKVLKISSGEPNNPAVWVDSGIHAREWITPATSTYVINQMVENGDGAHGVDWYFLPLVNPDGYEHSHTTDRLWRKNRSNPNKGPCAGTDLNRNFGYRWGGQGASRQPCRETYAGSGPFSEPETTAINKFVMSRTGKLKAYISLHSYGQYILYPWGYDRRVPPDYADLHRVGRAMAQAMKESGGQTYRVGSAAATLYPAAGGSDDWAKGTAKIKYAYTIELRDTGRHGFVLPAQYITPTAKEAYAALKVVASEVKALK